MRLFSLTVTLLSIALLSGCSSFPRPFGSKSSHKSQRTAKNDADDSDSEVDEQEFNKRLIVEDEDQEPESSGNDNVFKEHTKGRHRIKESDGLSSLMKDLIDPRTTEINRNLGYE